MKPVHIQKRTGILLAIVLLFTQAVSVFTVNAAIMQDAEGTSATNIVRLESKTVPAGSSATLSIFVDNEELVAGGEFLIEYPSQHLTLDDTGVQLIGRLQNFDDPSVSADNVDGIGYLKILFFNDDGNTLDPGTGAVIEIPYTVSVQASGTISMTVTKAKLLDDSFVPVPREVTIEHGAITVDSLSITPNQGIQGQSMNLQIQGQHVNWTANPPTNVSFGSGITVDNISVSDDTTLSVTIRINENASVGSQVVSVTAGGQTITTNNGFTVQRDVGPVTEVGIDIPDDNVGYPGGSILVPIEITSDVTGEGILAFAFTFTHDSIVRVDDYVKENTMSANWSITLHKKADQARIVGFSSSPLTGSGTLIYLRFEISRNAAVGTEVEVHFSDSRLNEGDPTPDPKNGKILIQMQPATISGTATAAHDFSRPISGLSIALAGAQDMVLTTDSDGRYSASVQPGDYTVTPAITSSNIGNALSVWDSVQIAIHDARGDDSSFDEHDKRVCDVIGEDGCTSFDAAQIALWRLNPALTDSSAGQLISSPYTRTYSLDNGDSHTNEDYEIYLSGDVTYDWPMPQQCRSIRAASTTAAIVVTVPSITAAPNYTMTVPIAIQNVSAQGLLGYELFLTFDSDILTVNGVTNQNSVSNQWALEKMIDETGEVRIISYGTSPLDSDGTLLNLSVTVQGEIGDQADLMISHLLFNDGQPVTKNINGQVIVSDEEISLGEPHTPNTIFLPIISN